MQDKSRVSAKTVSVSVERQLLRIGMILGHLGKSREEAQHEVPLLCLC